MPEYRGEAVETGATSRSGKVAPPIRRLVKEGHIRPGMLVLDWGAGKYARNADYLRKMGCVVYAYDPFNANGTDGFGRGAVSSQKPSRKIKFDVAFSCYVLNVVREKDEKEIVQELDGYAPVVFHITRHKDIWNCAFDTILGRKSNKWIMEWWHGPFLDAMGERKITSYEKITDEFCRFGFCTGPGKFQRIPAENKLRKLGYGIRVKNNSYMIFEKSKKRS